MYTPVTVHRRSNEGPEVCRDWDGGGGKVHGSDTAQSALNWNPDTDENWFLNRSRDQFGGGTEGTTGPPLGHGVRSSELYGPRVREFCTREDLRGVRRPPGQCGQTGLIRPESTQVDPARGESQHY